MNHFALISLLIGVVVANEECIDSVITACSATDVKDSVLCNSKIGGSEHVQSDLQSYVNLQLASSYDYLLLATHFNSYQKNRPGFQKLLQGLSDKSWNKAIELIRHITKRGGQFKFTQKQKSSTTVSKKANNKLEVDEMYVLGMILDFEKKLAIRAHRIHRRASLLGNHSHYYDPEITQFIEEEFLEYQTDIIRKISGYVNDLAKLVKTGDSSLSIYLFDEYLQKQ